MGLKFIAIDPDTDTDHCPAVFVEEGTGDLLFQGWTVTEAATLAEVRWLPRRQASDLCLPGNDFWLFDGRLLRIHHFSGDGKVVEDELCDDPAVVAMCSAAFEAVWDRAVPHGSYQLT
jgi:hypothetical protein